MRCSKKHCLDLAMDGANYCANHLRSEGVPRPGTQTARSAGRFKSDISGDAMSWSGEKKVAAKSPSKSTSKNPKNPIFLGQAATASETKPRTAKASKSGASASAKSVKATTPKQSSKTAKSDGTGWAAKGKKT